jgi:hypothetical protein
VLGRADSAAAGNGPGVRVATYLDAIRVLERLSAAARAAGAAAAADAMGRHFITHERDFTLLESGTHARGEPGNAAPGAPPARVSGWLGESFRLERAAGGGDSATSRAGPTAIYSRVQEMGAFIEKDPGYMIWGSNWDGAGWRTYYAHAVDVRAHPYMRRGVDEVIADGSLRDNAAEAFAAATGQP